MCVCALNCRGEDEEEDNGGLKYSIFGIFTRNPKEEGRNMRFIRKISLYKTS